MNQNARGVPVSKALADRVKKLIEKHGFKHCIDRLGVSRDSLTRVAAGMPVRKGTIVVIEKNLKEGVS